MNLIIFAGNLATSAELRQIISEKLNAAFARIDTRLSCIRISVRDLKGNRPGLEKRCQIIITQAGIPDIADPLRLWRGLGASGRPRQIGRSVHLLCCDSQESGHRC